MIKRFLFSLSALLILTGTASTLPAVASDCQNLPSHETSTPNCAPDETVPENESAGQMQARDLKVEQFKASAQAQLDAKKTEVKAHTQEQRQKSCEARKANLTKRMDNAVAHAKKHKETFDKIYTRVTEFVTNKNLTVTDYDKLTAAVDTAQSNATSSITALDELDFSVDCKSQTVAESVSTFQEAVKSTRDSLKDYRSSITDLIKSVKGASTSDTDSNQEAQ